jgi:hypothetical protein
MNSKLILIGLLLVLFSTQAYALSGANLVAYYKFDEPSGTNAIDSKNDSNGTITNALVNQPGKINTSYYFDATSDYVTLANESNFDFLTANAGTWTISMWVKPETINADRPLLSKSVFASDQGMYIKETGSGTGTPNAIQLVLLTNGSNYLTKTTPANSLTNGVWQLVTIRNNAGTISIDIDGQTKALTTGGVGTFTGANTSTQARIGAYDSTTASWKGWIDEVGIWKRNLSDTDILELYNSGTGLTYPFKTANFTYSINIEEEKIYLYDTSDLDKVIIDWNWLVDGLSISTDQNTSFIATELTDYNVCLIINDGDFSTCETINSGRFFGRGFIKLYDSLNNELDQVSYVISPAINGVSAGVLTDNNLDLNFTAITSSNYTFTFSKSSYTTLAFTIPLTQYTNFDYNFIMLDANKTTNVNFQVFNESGAYANTKTFYAYDYSLNKYVGIQTTDTLGRLTFNLDQTKSDYNFFSTDFNFGTTIWTINKPKDIVTLSDISGTWEYSITGPSYSNASNIAAGIQKLLLQNTVYPYLIKIVDTDKSYASTTFGLKSVTSEKEKTLTPYLYKYADADLKLIKLIDFATNQPHSSSEELTLNLYTDTNGLIPIGIFVNDSTGTYNIYMDENATYELQVLSQSYNLRPTLDIYYLYLTEDIGVIIDNNLIVDVNAPIMDANLPIIFTQLREAVFGCSSTNDNCYPSMIFSLIAVALLLIVLAISGQIGAISQSITIGILLTMFLIIGFIPLWLYGVGVVILIAWGVFGQ